MELDLSIGHATTNYLTSLYLHYIFFLSQASSLENDSVHKWPINWCPSWKSPIRWCIISQMSNKILHWFKTYKQPALQLELSTTIVINYVVTA